jgi:hypothetical protein
MEWSQVTWKIKTCFGKIALAEEYLTHRREMQMVIGNIYVESKLCVPWHQAM